MSKYEPQAGDIVSCQGVVSETGSVWFDGTDYGQFVDASHLTFVSRPEPTYTVELTAAESRLLQELLYSEANEPDLRRRLRDAVQ